MVQSLNAKALLTLASVIRRPSLLVPHVAVASISELNYEALKTKCGIKAVVFDKDNTLTAPYGMALHPNAVQGLERARSVFGLSNVAIMSNSAGTLDDPGYEDAKAIEEGLGIAVIRHNEKKPGGLQEVLDHFDIDDAAELCMVGDRLLTDIVFGNLYGMLTIHTLPLCSGEENRQDNKVARVVRKLENAGLYGDWFVGRRLLKSPIKHKFWKGEEHCSLKLGAVTDNKNLVPQQEQQQAQKQGSSDTDEESSHLSDEKQPLSNNDLDGADKQSTQS